MKRVGLYPGTFDPVTMGHVDIIGRAVKLVDHLIVGVAVSSAKNPLFALDDRVAMMKEECARLSEFDSGKLEIRSFDTLLIRFAEMLGVNIVIRGLRAVSDFEYEFQMTAMNEQINRQIETVFLMADVKHQAIASRLVKEIARFGGDVTPFVPPSVCRRLQEKYR